MKRHDSDNSSVAAKLQRFDLSGKVLYKKQIIIIIIITTSNLENVWKLQLNLKELHLNSKSEGQFCTSGIFLKIPGLITRDVIIHDEWYHFYP